MHDLNLKARGQSLNDLVGAMEEDDAKSIPTLMIRITATPEGIEIEKSNPDGSFSKTESEGEEKNEIESEEPEMEAGENEIGKPEAEQEMGAEMPENESADSGQSAFEMLIAKKKKEKEGGF
jgi:hypothetical protein